MKLELSLSNIIHVSRYFLFTITLGLVCVIFFTFFPYEYMFQAAVAASIMSVLWLLLFTLNYLIWSKSIFEIDVNKLIILIDDKLYNLKDFDIIQKNQSFKRTDYDIPYFPWMTGIYFYYKFVIEDKEYFLTCYMISKSQEEEISKALSNLIEVKNRFIPFISRNENF